MRIERADAWLRAGKITEAIAEIAELVNSSDVSRWVAADWYNAACLYSVAASKIEDKRQEYADRAMQLLQKAVQAGWMDVAHLGRDTDLDVLREREDYKKLLAELQAKPTTNPSVKP